MMGMTGATPLLIWTATRTIGFAAYATAFLCCGIAWLWAVRYCGKQDGVARLALLVASVELLLSFDMVLEWRLTFHTLLANLFMKHNLYGQRRCFQAASLLVLGAALLFFLASVFRRLRARPGGLMAVGGLSMSVTLWLTEIISMHDVDKSLYHTVDDVMVIAFLWAVLCVVTILGVGIEAGRTVRQT